MQSLLTIEIVQIFLSYLGFTVRHDVALGVNFDSGGLKEVLDVTV